MRVTHTPPVAKKTLPRYQKSEVTRVVESIDIDDSIFLLPTMLKMLCTRSIQFIHTTLIGKQYSAYSKGRRSGGQITMIIFFPQV